VADEEHLALIRGLLRSIAHVRKVLRKHQAVERSAAEAKEVLYAAYDRPPAGNTTDGSWE
jgi:hypothetical protein